MSTRILAGTLAINLVATYQEQVAPPWNIIISASPANGGTCKFADNSSAIGTWDIPSGQSLAVRAEPLANYTFDGWTSNITAVNGSTSASITVLAQTSGVSYWLTANFTYHAPETTINVITNPAMDGVEVGIATLEAGPYTTKLTPNATFTVTIGQDYWIRVAMTHTVGSKQYAFVYWGTVITDTANPKRVTAQ